MSNRLTPRSLTLYDHTGTPVDPELMRRGIRWAEWGSARSGDGVRDGPRWLPDRLGAALVNPVAALFLVCGVTWALVWLLP